MDDIFYHKRLLRQEIKKRKALQSEVQYFSSSAMIMSEIELLPEFQKADIVLAYWSIKGEVYTHEFIRKWSQSKRILLPSVDGDTMLIKEYKSENQLISGDLYGIPEPDGMEFTDYKIIDFVIVPGVAFDLNNNRMGRGKAYYDRFLKLLTSYKCGICFNFQLVDEVPSDENDIKMDVVITD
jgi:5-formyltetrahydrofolate cyclo-ligase